MKRLFASVLFTPALLPLAGYCASTPKIVECEGTTITEIDAVGKRLDSKSENSFHAIFEIGEDGVRTIEGPMDLESLFPDKRKRRLSFDTSKKGIGGLRFYRDSGRFEINRLEFPDGSPPRSRQESTSASSGYTE